MPPVLDILHLKRQTAGDAALAQALLALFRDQMEAQWARLVAAPEAGVRREAAHTLRGAALAVGAFALAGEAESVELDPQRPLDRLAAILASTRAAVNLNANEP